MGDDDDDYAFSSAAMRKKKPRKLRIKQTLTMEHDEDDTIDTAELPTPSRPVHSPQQQPHRPFHADDDDNEGESMPLPQISQTTTRSPTMSSTATRTSPSTSRSPLPPATVARGNPPAWDASYSSSSSSSSSRKRRQPPPHAFKTEQPSAMSSSLSPPKRKPDLSLRPSYDLYTKRSHQEDGSTFKSVAEQRQDRQHRMIADKQRREAIKIQAAARGYIVRKGLGRKNEYPPEKTGFLVLSGGGAGKGKDSSPSSNSESNMKSSTSSSSRGSARSSRKQIMSPLGLSKSSVTGEEKWLQLQRVDGVSPAKSGTSPEDDDEEEEVWDHAHTPTLFNSYRQRSRGGSRSQSSSGSIPSGASESASSGSSSSSADSEAQTYEKYRKYLQSETKEEEDAPWRRAQNESKPKIGAPPSLEYSYRYSAAAEELQASSSSQQNQQQPLQSPSQQESTTPSKKKKSPKLQSDKLPKEDLKTIGMMLLGGDDSSDDGTMISTTHDRAGGVSDASVGSSDEESPRDNLSKGSGGSRGSDGSRHSNRSQGSNRSERSSNSGGGAVHQFIDPSSTDEDDDFISGGKVGYNTEQAYAYGNTAVPDESEDEKESDVREVKSVFKYTYEKEEKAPPRRQRKRLPPRPNRSTLEIDVMPYQKAEVPLDKDSPSSGSSPASRASPSSGSSPGSRLTPSSESSNDNVQGTVIISPHPYEKNEVSFDVDSSGGGSSPSSGSKLNTTSKDSSMREGQNYEQGVDRFTRDSAMSPTGAALATESSDQRHERVSSAYSQPTQTPPTKPEPKQMVSVQQKVQQSEANKKVAAPPQPPKKTNPQPPRKKMAAPPLPPSQEGEHENKALNAYIYNQVDAKSEESDNSESDNFSALWEQTVKEEAGDILEESFGHNSKRKGMNELESIVSESSERSGSSRSAVSGGRVGKDEGNLEISLHVQELGSRQYQNTAFDNYSEDEGESLDFGDNTPLLGVKPKKQGVKPKKQGLDESDEFSFKASGDLEYIDGSLSDHPEYDHHASKKMLYDDDLMNQGLQNFDMSSSTMTNNDVEAGLERENGKKPKVDKVDEESSESSASSASSVRKKPGRKHEKPSQNSGLQSAGVLRSSARGFVCLLILAAIGVPLYFLVWYNDNGSNTETAPPQEIPPLFPPSPPVAQAPTPSPSPPSQPTPPVDIPPTSRPQQPTPPVDIPPTMRPQQPTPPVDTPPTMRPQQPTPPVDIPTMPPTKAPQPSPTVLPQPVPTVAPQPSPTARPQPAPTAPPQPSPTARPQPSPTAPPQEAPTPNTAQELRDFLISVWPSLEEDLIGFSSPQYFAFDWLANDSKLNEYSDEQKLQRFTLATFYFSTDGDNWRHNDLWLSEENECLWYSASNAVPCNDDRSYTSLDLDLNGLSGTIPSELALLSNSLSRIDLSARESAGVALIGTLPAELGFLSNLEYVNLSGNQLDGTLPASIGKWRKIQSIDMSNNQFGGELPFSIVNWGILTALDLEGNNLEGSLPTTVGFLRNLRSLNLSSNRFTGAIPSEIGNLILMQYLSLHDNQFTLLPTAIGNLMLIQHLLVQNNKISGSLPIEIGRLANLINLDLSKNFMTGSLPSELGNLISIRDQFNLSFNSFSGPLPESLGQMILVRNLLLQSNKLVGPVPASFAKLDRLNTLRLEDNLLTGTVPAVVCDVYSETYPVFVADCLPGGEVVCDCCMYCCGDGIGCECQFANTELSFLCGEFKKSPGLEQRIFGNVFRHNQG